MRRDGSGAGAVQLGTFTAEGFDKGAGAWKRALWYVVNALVVRAAWNPFMGVKRWLLRAFGARVGRGLVMKNEVRVKFPWKFRVGNDVWLGEGAWIDNLDAVDIGNDVCISQGAMLLTGNHDYTQPGMPYRNAPIRIADGAWIGARATVCPGVTVGEGAVLCVGAVATGDLEPWGIYKGVPATRVRTRRINDQYAESKEIEFGGG